MNNISELLYPNGEYETTENYSTEKEENMRICVINKFLHRNGGSETYIFKLGEQLEKMGHEVQYFGMDHKGRCVGNRVNAYTSDMDFHGGSKPVSYTHLTLPTN